MLSKKPALQRTSGLFFFLLLLLMASFLAITQETDVDYSDIDIIDLLPDEFTFDSLPGEEFSEWTQLAPARWFRSNAGGMTLEEIPSRLAALRNKYALVIDYIRADELPEVLLPFFQSDYTIEIRVLYEQGQESRRQWLFRDTAGTTRLVAVFNQKPDDDESEPGEPEAGDDFYEAFDWHIIETGDDFPEELDWHIAVYPSEAGWQEEDETVTFDDEAAVEMPPGQTASAIRISRGFLDSYSEDGRISVERQFSEDGTEIESYFFYHDSTLVKTEGWRKMPDDEELQKIHTDYYRYNRSAALRLIERMYHTEIMADPVRISFPYRVLDAARDDSFMYDPLPPEFDFLGDSYAAEDYRMVYNIGDRGRILTQTLLDNEGNQVWVVQNTWSGDRITAILKIEGEEKRLIEFEYDDNGDRILERNLHNGVLERLVRVEGDLDIEELYMNGEVILRAVWENGRKISEERIRNRQPQGNRG